MRRDDTILAFDATAPTTQAFSDAAAVGSATVAARRDHKHAMMAAPTSVSGNAGTVTNATLTTAVTVNGGTLTLTANAANTSVLTIGAGAVSVSGANTGDNAANSTYSSDYRAANFVAGTNYLAPNGSAASLTSFPTLNQNTTGSAGLTVAAVTFNTTGGAAAGTTFNGSASRTVDYSTIGAAAATHNQDATTITTGTLDGDRLPDFSATKKAGVPATGTPSGKYLKDDGTWGTPTAAVPLDIQDEGVSLTTAPTIINFVGTGVTVTEPIADQVTVTVTGGGDVYGPASGSTGKLVTYADNTGKLLAVSGYTAPSLAALSISKTAAGELAAMTLKASTTGSDLILIEDAAEANAKKYSTIGGLPSKGDGGFAFKYAFDTGTGGSPSAGTIQLNNATLGSVTIAYIHETDAAGVAIDYMLDDIQVGDLMMLSNADRSKYLLFEVNAPFTSGASVDSLPVAYKFGTGAVFAPIGRYRLVSVG